MALLIRGKWSINRESYSPFECGFDPKGRGRLPFSLRFYLIRVIFLVFDVEVTYLLPLIPRWEISSKYIAAGGFTFVVILLLGTLYEWKKGSLD